MRGLLGLIVVLGALVLAFGAIGLSIYGLVLAFQASVILGLLALFIEPFPLVFGVAMFFFSTNIPQLIMEMVNK